MTKILILYVSRHGSTQNLARNIATGVEMQGAEAVLRTVNMRIPSSTDDKQQADNPIVTEQDWAECDGLALGSPTRFGHMAVELQEFIESTSASWLKGEMSGKPACVFTSSSSLHGGQESTLLSMAIPLLHHGMLLTGIPYEEPALHKTESGGTPYGATHVAFNQNSRLSADEKELAQALGRRIAFIATKLKEKS